MQIDLRSMTIDDYDAVFALLLAMPGICLRGADSKENISRYLTRNPRMSYVAADGAVIAGCIFAGHDGRRGYLNHLAVAPSHRMRGIGKSLVTKAIAALGEEGILKVHIDLLTGNEAGLKFWLTLGFHERGDIRRLSFIVGNDTTV